MPSMKTQLQQAFATMPNPNSSQVKQTIAFFGATGGTAGSALAHALNDGNPCTALARDSKKLRSYLVDNHNVSATTIDQYLTIVDGHGKDSAAVSTVLRNPLDQTKLVDTILFGIGTLPTYKLSLTSPIAMNDPTVCEDCTRTIFTCLSTLAEQGIATTTAGTKPLYITISTTGISDKRRDVPMSLYPLYHWALAVPHADKKKTEQLVFANAGRTVRDFVVMRPTLLMDNEPKGLWAVRSGWEWGTEEGEKNGRKAPGPMLGWAVGRKDVGEFIYRKVMVEGGWEGKCVSLTY